MLAALILWRVYVTSDQIMYLASDPVNIATYVKSRVIHNIWVEQVGLTFQTVVDIEETNNMPLALTSLSVQMRDLVTRTSDNPVLDVMTACVQRRMLAMRHFYTELAAISLHIRRYYLAKRLDRITAEFEKLTQLASAVEQSCSESRELAPTYRYSEISTHLSLVHAQHSSLVMKHTAAFTGLGALVNKIGIFGLALNFAYTSQYTDEFEKMCFLMHEYALQRASYYAA